METQRRKTRTWSSFEDQRLIAAVSRFGLDNWSHVASFVGNGRTRAQCAQRWNRGLDPRISRDHWSPEEEQKLLILIENKNGKGWTHIANEMGNRSDVQCRYHYLQMKKEGKIPQTLTDATPPNSATETFNPGISIPVSNPTGPASDSMSIPMPFQQKQPHSLDYLERNRFAFSPEPAIPKAPDQFIPPTPNSAIPAIPQQSMFSGFSQFPPTPPNQNAYSQPTPPPPPQPQQQQQQSQFDLFKIPPPNYAGDSQWDDPIFEDEKNDEEDDFTIKMPEFNSSMYSLW